MTDSQVMVGGLRYLAAEFVLTREDWRRHHKGGDMLLDGLLSRGYARQQGDRYAITPAGRACLEDADRG